jgi:hypothetical protein
MFVEGSGIVEVLEYLKAGASVAGILVPVGTLLYFTGAVVQRIKGLEDLITRLLDQEADCREAREQAELDLTNRVSRIEGWRNGHGHG